MPTVENSLGFLLRVRRLTDTSLIAHWLTPEHGRLATVAKGALRPKSVFRGKLDLFFEANFSFARSRRSELHVLRELVLINTHAHLREDLGALQQASYAALLVEQTTETETPLPEVFHLVQDFLEALSTGGPAPAKILAFELKLLEHLGLSPDPARTHLGPAALELLRQLGQQETFTAPTTTPASLLELNHFLHGYLIYHFGRLANGRTAAIGTIKA